MPEDKGFISEITSLPSQLEKGYGLADEVEVGDGFSNIVITGMGGSYIAGFMLSSFLRDSNMNIITNHDFDLPSQVGEDSLVIAISYSGNTEETISAYRKAHRKGCTVVALTSGGKLEELARLNDTPLVKIPPGMQPRNTLGYQLSALLKVMESAGLVTGVEAELKRTASSLKKDIFKEHAQNLADKLQGKNILIYSSELFYPVAYLWKTSFNENAGAMAFANTFPEMVHNEVMGFVNAKRSGDFHIVMLKSQDDSKEIHDRMKAVKEEARKRDIDVTEMGVKGNALLTRLLSAALIGQLSAYYLAGLYGKDPEKVSIIESIKERV